jgi:hypothetical protein
MSPSRAKATAPKALKLGVALAATGWTSHRLLADLSYFPN